jgi:hypothetical protein
VKNKFQFLYIDEKHIGGGILLKLEGKTYRWREKHIGGGIQLKVEETKKKNEGKNI